MIIKVIGMDPSMSNWGFATADLNLDTLEVSNVELSLTKTEKTKQKRIRVNSDDMRRSKELYKSIQKNTKDVVMSFVEVPHGSQSARAMASYGMCVALLASVQSYSMIQLSEADLKLATLGKKTGTKEEAIEWATSKHPEANWPTRGGKIIKSQAEHMSDAIAAIYAGLLSEDFNNARAILKFAKSA